MNDDPKETTINHEVTTQNTTSPAIIDGLPADAPTVNQTTPADGNSTNTPGNQSNSQTTGIPGENTDQPPAEESKPVSPDANVDIKPIDNPPASDNSNNHSTTSQTVGF